jgi:hypothetical protein
MGSIGRIKEISRFLQNSRVKNISTYPFSDRNLRPCQIVSPEEYRKEHSMERNQKEIKNAWRVPDPGQEIPQKQKISIGNS